MSCQPKATASPRGRASHRSAKAPPAPLFCGSRDPRRMRMSCQLKAKASPPGRASHRSAKAPLAPRFFWEARPAANAEILPTHKQNFAPRSGLLQKSQSAARAASVGAATPRRKRWFCQLKKQKLRPEVGPPTEEPKRRPRCFFLWEARPAANADVLPAQSKSFAPRSGLLQKSQKRHPHRFFLWEPRPAANQASEPLSRAAPRSVRRARRSRRRRAETGCARLAPRQPSEPRPRLPPAAFQGAIQ